MADIYRSASEVIVFLGRSDIVVEAAITHINTQVERVFGQSGLDGREALRQDQHDFLKVYLQSRPINTSAWAAVQILLERPWFTRIWTFQEIVLAKQAHFVCGPHILRWIHFAAWFSATRDSLRERQTSETPFICGIHWELFECITLSRALHLRSLTREDRLSPCDLHVLLTDLRRRQARQSLCFARSCHQHGRYRSSSRLHKDGCRSLRNDSSCTDEISARKLVRPQPCGKER